MDSSSVASAVRKVLGSIGYNNFVGVEHVVAGRKKRSLVDLSRLEARSDRPISKGSSCANLQRLTAVDSRSMHLSGLELRSRRRSRRKTQADLRLGQVVVLVRHEVTE